VHGELSNQVLGQGSSWAELAPGQDESAGKRRSGRSGQGIHRLRSALVQAADAQVRDPDTYLTAIYRRLVVRLGVKRAIIAIARRLLIAVYHILVMREAYRERGPQLRDERQQEQRVNRLGHELEQCGYQVTLDAPAAAA